MDETKKRSKKWVWIIILIVIVGLAILWQTGQLGVGAQISSDAYQAVFLTNNQVYFGKLDNLNSQYPVLRDVFYLQITQDLQPRPENAQPITNINLVKLGGEIHGPEDVMYLNRDQIMFYEDLQDDSQVTQAIEKYLEEQK